MILENLFDPTTVGTPWVYVLACLFGVGTTIVGVLVLVRRHDRFLPEFSGGALLALGLSVVIELTANSTAVAMPHNVADEYERLGVMLIAVFVLMLMTALAYFALGFILVANKSHAPTRAWSFMAMAAALTITDAALHRYEHARTALGRAEANNNHYQYHATPWNHWVLWALAGVMLAIAVVMLTMVWRRRRNRREHLEHYVI